VRNLEVDGGQANRLLLGRHQQSGEGRRQRTRGDNLSIAEAPRRVDGNLRTAAFLDSGTVVEGRPSQSRCSVGAAREQQDTAFARWCEPRENGACPGDNRFAAAIRNSSKMDRKSGGRTPSTSLSTTSSSTAPPDVRCTHPRTPSATNSPTSPNLSPTTKPRYSKSSTPSSPKPDSNPRRQRRLSAAIGY
jgi:hypothetical protein